MVATKGRMMWNLPYRQAKTPETAARLPTQHHHPIQTTAARLPTQHHHPIQTTINRGEAIDYWRMAPGKGSHGGSQKIENAWNNEK